MGVFVGDSGFVDFSNPSNAKPMFLRLAWVRILSILNHFSPDGSESVSRYNLFMMCVHFCLKRGLDVEPMSGVFSCFLRSRVLFGTQGVPGQVPRVHMVSKWCPLALPLA